MAKDRDALRGSVHLRAALDEVTTLPAGEAERRLRELLGLRDGVRLDSAAGNAAIRNMMPARARGNPQREIDRDIISLIAHIQRRILRS